MSLRNIPKTKRLKKVENKKVKDKKEHTKESVVAIITAEEFKVKVNQTTKGKDITITSTCM